MSAFSFYVYMAIGFLLNIIIISMAVRFVAGNGKDLGLSGRVIGSFIGFWVSFLLCFCLMTSFSIFGCYRSDLPVKEIRKGSAAAKAGFKNGDRLIAVNSEEVLAGQRLGNFFEAHQNRKATFTVERVLQGKSIQKEIEVLISDANISFFGIVLHANKRKASLREVIDNYIDIAFFIPAAPYLTFLKTHDSKITILVSKLGVFIMGLIFSTGFIIMFQVLLGIFEFRRSLKEHKPLLVTS